MKKQLLLVFVLLSFLACSKTEIIEEYKHAIEYGVTVPKATNTKGIPVTNANFSEFSVIGGTHIYPSDECKFLYGGRYKEADMDVIRDGEGNIFVEHKNPEDVAYAPKEGFNTAIAISPTITNENGALRSCFDKFKTVSRYGAPNMEFDFIIENNFKDQIDLIYANMAPIDQGRKVQLEFHHVLSQIVFKTQVMNNNLRVKINSLEIGNAIKRVSFNAGYPDPLSTDEPLRTNISSSISDSVKSGITMSDGATFITTDEVGFLIPDVFWGPEDEEWTSGNVNNTKGSYLKLKVVLENIALDNSAISNKIYSGDIYIPFNEQRNWYFGSRYVYTLKFGDPNSVSGGGGLDDNGKPILSDFVVGYDVNVEDWQDASEKEVEM